jgi:hypothetical protein
MPRRRPPGPLAGDAPCATKVLVLFRRAKCANMILLRGIYQL